MAPERVQQATPAPSVRGRWAWNEPMARHSSWRCGGPARAYFEPADRADLLDFLRQAGTTTDLLWIGLGSNLLVRDGGLPCTVIATTTALTTWRWEGATRLYAESGVSCAQLARIAARADRAGLEFLAGVPGTVGGALRMNAGAHGGETWQHVAAVEMVTADGRVTTHAASAFTPRYRGVAGPPGWFLAAWFELPRNADGAGAARVRAVLAQRSATQPTGKATCGSVFKNPPGDYAGRLIEACGLKGYRVGGCQVSTKHANFIVNDAGATAADVEHLVQHVQAEVARRTGIVLEPEVLIVGAAAASAEDAP